MEQKSMGWWVSLLVAVAMSVLLVLVLKKKSADASEDAAMAAACEGPSLKGNLQARNDAMEAGYRINGVHDCIDKASFDAVKQQMAAAQKARAEAASAPERTPSAGSVTGLAEARRDFQTTISLPPAEPSDLPQPPAELFVRADYVGVGNRSLPAFVTPDPGDRQRHPAIVWLTGGDSSSLGDFWTPGAASNDQSAKAFREAGLIMMFPTLRGGNRDPGDKQYFLGEVDDVLAAADRLSTLPYVDPTRIYLGGHSTGGTLALLTAESSGRFKAVFAFGPVADVSRYPPSLMPIDFSRHATAELRLRSPGHWLKGLSTPTYLIEGRNEPGNIDDLDAMCRAGASAVLHCIPVDGENHFSVIAKVSRVIAARLAVSVPGMEFSLRPEEFQQNAAGAAR